MHVGRQLSGISIQNVMLCGIDSIRRWQTWRSKCWNEGRVILTFAVPKQNTIQEGMWSLLAHFHRCFVGLSYWLRFGTCILVHWSFSSSHRSVLGEHDERRDLAALRLQKPLDYGQEIFRFCSAGMNRPCMVDALLSRACFRGNAARAGSPVIGFIVDHIVQGVFSVGHNVITSR